MLETTPFSMSNGWNPWLCPITLNMHEYVHIYIFLIMNLIMLSNVATRIRHPENELIRFILVKKRKILNRTLKELFRVRLDYNFWWLVSKSFTFIPLDVDPTKSVKFLCKEACQVFTWSYIDNRNNLISDQFSNIYISS